MSEDLEDHGRLQRAAAVGVRADMRRALRIGGWQIVCTRKLGVRPPDCLIPAGVLQLHRQYTSGQISKDADRARWWDVRKVLRRYCLIDEPPASRLRVVSHAESCRRWREKQRQQVHAPQQSC